MRPALAAAAAAALALLAAAAVVGHRRQRAAEISPFPVVASAGPSGLAALRAWLAETGREPLVLEDPGARPPPGAVLVLAAPRAPLTAEEAERVIAHAERGGLVVWAVGRPPQPELARRLGIAAPPSPDTAAPPGRAVLALAPHPLFAGLSLRTGGATLESDLPDALAVAGQPGGAPRAAALSIRRGAGEVIALAGADLLQNRWLAEGDDLSFWARVAARGPVVLDERFRDPPGAPLPPSARGIAVLAGQGLLAALAWLWARGRRLGAVRPPPPPEAGRTAADYLASLAVLYRRARAEPELARGAWRRFRRELERAGVPAGLDADAACRRLARTRPRAAEAFREAAALARDAEAAGPGELARLVRAVAAAEGSLRRGAPR